MIVSSPVKETLPRGNFSLLDVGLFLGRLLPMSMHFFDLARGVDVFKPDAST